MSRIGLFGQISEVTEHLFLSGAGVLKPEKLRQKKISCIINATVEEPSAHIPGIDYLRISIEDSPYAKIDQYFDIVADKIKSVKDRGGRTLVHCVAGVSRSASLCMIYLVKHERMTLRQAYHFVKSARPVVKPNVGFWKQMIEYERKLKGSSSVQMIETNQHGLALPDVYCTEMKQRLIQNHSLPKSGTCRNITITQVPFKYSQTSSFSRPLDSSYRRFTTSSIIPPIFSLPSRQNSPFSMLTSTLARQRANDLFDTYQSDFSTF